MRQKSKTQGTSEQIVKDIRRATRKRYSAEEKIRIVLDGLRGNYSIAEPCRREGIAESLYYSWSKEFLEAGKRRLAGVPLPHVETGIALSAIVLGLGVALAARPPIWIAAVIVGIFAIFHGHAHGAELPEAANPFAYALGFVLATGFLHILGFLFGLITKWPVRTVLVRTGGAVIATAGVAFLTGFA